MLVYFAFFQDVFILDNKKDVFVWVGRGASKAESKNALAYAHVSFPLFMCINDFIMSVQLISLSILTLTHE